MMPSSQDDRCRELQALLCGSEMTETGFRIGGIDHSTADGTGVVKESRETVLEGRLYAQLHLRNWKELGSGPPTTASENAAFLASLSNANPCTEHWDPDWSFIRHEDSAVVVRSGELEIWAKQQEVRPPEPAVGQRVRLLMPGERRELLYGFYAALGDASPHPPGTNRVRIYWNIQQSGAVGLLARLCCGLNAACVPFLYKTLSDPRGYERTDAAVLYVAQSDLPVVMPIVDGVYDAQAAWMRPDTSFFALRLAPGLGLAEDLGWLGRSFGQIRALELATAIVRHWGIVSGDGQPELDVAASMGRSWSHPHLAAHSRSRYIEYVREWPPVSASPRGNRKRPTLVPSVIEFDRDPRPTETTGETALLTDQDLLGFADAIAEFLESSAIRNGGRITWMGRVHGDSPGSAGSYRTLGVDVYNGLSGVAMFFAELMAVGGTQRYAETLAAIVSQIVACCDSQVSVMQSRGYYTGAGGVMCTMLRCADLLDDAAARTKAHEIAEHLVSLPVEVTETDVISGAAGMIVPLLELSDWAASDVFGKLSWQWAHELAQTTVRDGHWVASGHPSSPATPLTGFSHGAAGYAWAMNRAHRTFSEQEFLSAADCALSYEDSFFEPSVGNWPDLRDYVSELPRDQVQASRGANRRFAVAWCHGAAGIGMARLAIGDRLGIRRAVAKCAQELASAIESPVAQDLSLCHGLTGVAETLLLSGGDTNLQLARRLIGNSVSRYGTAFERWPAGVPGGSSPGLMLGLAGLGLHFLRGACPRSVASPVMPSGSRIIPSSLDVTVADRRMTAGLLDDERSRL